MAPPPQPNKNDFSDPAAFFQEMMAGFDPNRSGATGRGVDHNGDNTNYPAFWPGFPFGRPPHPPAPPGPPGADHPRPPSPPNGPTPPHPPPPPGHGHHRPHPPPGAWSWGGPAAGGWFADDGDFYFGDGHHRGGRGNGRHGHHGRGRRHNRDSDEEGTRDKPFGVSDDEKKEKTSDEKKSTTSQNEKSGSPDTMREDIPDPDEMVPEYEESSNKKNNNEFYTGGFGGFGHGWGGRRGHGGFGGRGGCRGGFGRRHHRDRDSFPCNAAPGAGTGPNEFNFPNMMRGIMSHPFLQHMSTAARNYNGNANPDNTTENNDDVNSFSPPVDLFNTPRAYVLHIALPGVKREDVGVHWDPEHGILSVSGVVHRPGDEAFLATLHSSERRVGVFEKKITLPPRDLNTQEQPREEIDSESIAAKLDDGVLVVMVPKLEKEWTEIRKVDIL